MSPQGKANENSSQDGTNACPSLLHPKVETTRIEEESHHIHLNHLETRNLWRGEDCVRQTCHGTGDTQLFQIRWNRQKVKPRPWVCQTVHQTRTWSSERDPMSEWEHIFKGEAVDLNKIFSSLEVKRNVKRSMAWRSASRAISLLRSFSSTESKNWQNMEITLSDSLQLSPITIASPHCMLPPCSTGMMELNIGPRQMHCR